MKRTMGLSDTLEVLAYLKAAYPRQELQPNTAQVYASLLEDLEVEIVWRAVKRHAVSSAFFPAPSEIRKAVAEALVSAPSAELAYAEVRKWLASGASGAKWSHALIGEAVKAIGGSWKLQHSETPAAVRREFLETYEALRVKRLDDVVVGSLEAHEERKALAASGRVMELPAHDDVAWSGEG